MTASAGAVIISSRPRRAPVAHRRARRCVRLARRGSVPKQQHERRAAPWRWWSSERLARYGFGDGHPFGPDRHAAFMREFASRGLDRRVRVLEPRIASDEELRAFHTAAYLDFVRERSASGSGFLDGGDTPAFRGVYEAAAGVVGATLSAMEAILHGRVPAGLRADRRPAPRRARSRGRLLRLQRLRRRDRAAQARRASSASPTSTSTRTTAMACSTPSRTMPAVVFADLHEDGRYLYPGTGAAEEIGTGAAQRHQAQPAAAAGRR